MVQPPPPEDAPSPRCGECGYDLRGSHRSEQCPECGRPLHASDLWVEDPSNLDPGTALERSGFGPLAWSSWISAGAVSTLLAIPWFGVVGMLGLWLATLGRLAGWWRFRTGPLRRFDDIGFERAIRVPSLLEPLAGLMCFVVAIAAISGRLPASAVLVALAVWNLVGLVGLLLPTVVALRLGRQADDVPMRFVGGLAIVLTLVTGLLGLGVLAIRFTVAEGLTTWTWGIGTPILIGTGLTTLGSMAIAHLVSVLIHGIDGVLLESHIDARARGPQQVKVGGALITVGVPGEDSRAPGEHSPEPGPLPLEDPPTRTGRS